ncbi:MAG: sulfatase [Candidatus Aminicenantaceae bacterium]
MNYIKKITFILLLSFIVIYSFHCKKEEEPEFRIPVKKFKKIQLYRFIDHISEDNVKESPLENIIKNFKLIKEKAINKWKYIPELSTSSIEMWAFTTSHQILGNPHERELEDINLFSNDEEVNFSYTFASKKTSWNWYDANEKLDLNQYEGYDKDERGVVIPEGNSFEFEKFLPEGNITIDFHIVNKQWKKYKPEFNVTFNNKIIKKIKVTNRNWYRIRTKTPMGNYLIGLKPVNPGAKNQTNDEHCVTLGLVRMVASSDIVFLSQPRKNKLNPNEQNYQFHYRTPRILSEGKKNLSRQMYLYLYQLKGKHPIYDSGIKENPLSIKKKITIGEHTYNIIIAPSKSAYQIPLKIPSKAFLEFGYGILNESPIKDSNEVFKFQILLNRSSESKVLFDKKICWDDQKGFLYQTIDLSEYSGKKGKLSFITEKAEVNKKDKNTPPVVPLWVNPLIYTKQEQQSMNVILISLDTLRADHVGCYGYHRDTSPNLDQFAKDSVVFKNTFSTTSWTLPAHISMLTSLNSLNHQVYYPQQKMDKDVYTMADFLRVNQFYCAGLTGGGYLSSKYGFSKGFDTYYGVRLYGDKSIRFDEAELMGKLATDWLSQNKDKKFFLFIHTYQPHDPYINPSHLGQAFVSKDAKWKKVNLGNIFKGDVNRYNVEFSEKEKQNIVDLYDGEIKYTDFVLVKPILDKLKELGIYENSLIIITSDHGEELYDHKAWLHDHNIYNEGIKIPLIIKFPRSLFKGTVIHKTANITDIFPTVLDQMDIHLKTNIFDGKSLFPLIQGKEEKERTFMTDLAIRNIDQEPPTLISTNDGNYKLILNKTITSPYAKEKCVEVGGSQIELYDMNKDPGETINLAGDRSYRGLCFRLLNKINDYYKKADWKKQKKETVVLDEALRERLKSLGYIK